MALHISGKLLAIGLVLAALITAFSAPAYEPPPIEPVPLAFSPQALVLDVPIETSYFAVQLGPRANPRFQLRATAYNSEAGQTDSTPFITATGARTSFGIVAVSRDLLGMELPYGSLVRLRDLGSFYTGRGVGQFQSVLDSQGLFIVEDTMHARKTLQLDVWFADRQTALNWGVRRIEVELVRYGRHGPELATVSANDFRATPRLLALQ